MNKIDAHVTCRNIFDITYFISTLKQVIITHVFMLDTIFRTNYHWCIPLFLKNVEKKLYYVMKYL